MYVQIIKREWKKAQLHKLHARVMGEGTDESPLHELPEVLRLLSEKDLKSYAVHMLTNPFGRFDFEIHAEIAHILDEHAPMDLEKKVTRLQHFFYEARTSSDEFMSYDDFFHELTLLKGKLCDRTDEELFGYPVRWHGLLDTYQLIHPETIPMSDTYHQILHQTDDHWITPALNHKACPFDSDLFREEQVICGFNHFLVAINYRPIGDAVFHMMLLPYKHAFDFSAATPDILFELEALLRATLKLWPRSSNKMAIYMQKHAQSGMTVPHLHIHVLSPSKRSPFLEDVKRQLRFFASLLDGRDEEAHAFARPPLTAEEMKQQIWRFSKPLGRLLASELHAQKLLLHNLNTAKSCSIVTNRH